MALDAIRRALSKGLSLLGEPSTLDGLNVGPVSIEWQVLVDAGILGMSSDNPMLPRDVATFGVGIQVAKGQTLVHPDGVFLVDVRIQRNPYGSRWIIVPKMR